jgi:Holliday junction resolvase RusA-like endonuclease
MFESSKRVKPWRDLVKQAASIRTDQLCLLGPLQPPYRVEVWFYITKPRTTRAKHPVAPTIGDLDKLVRGCLDALTQSGLIEDDRFITQLEAFKEWTGAGETPGAIIRVIELSTEKTDGGDGRG